MNIVVDWNGKDVPEQLKELPAGRYIVEAVDDAPHLSEAEDAGLRAAMRSVANGGGVQADVARDQLRGRARR